MARSPDGALEVALEQRRQVLETAQLELAARERVIQAEAERLASLDARVMLAEQEIVREHVHGGGRPLDVPKLGQLDVFLQRCERDAAAQRARLTAARDHADDARSTVVAAHQRVRSLELVLEARARERAERGRRGEVREADEVAARIHAGQRAGLWGL